MKSPLFTNSIILVLLALVFITCKQQTDLQIDLPINYLALGDSYTIGHGVEAAQSAGLFLMTVYDDHQLYTEKFFVP